MVPGSSGTQTQAPSPCLDVTLASALTSCSALRASATPVSALLNPHAPDHVLKTARGALWSQSQRCWAPEPPGTPVLPLTTSSAPSPPGHQVDAGSAPSPPLPGGRPSSPRPSATPSVSCRCTRQRQYSVRQDERCCVFCSISLVAATRGSPPRIPVGPPRGLGWAGRLPWFDGADCRKAHGDCRMHVRHEFEIAGNNKVGQAWQVPP